MSRNSSRGQFLIFGDGPSKGGTVLNFLYSGGRLPGSDTGGTVLNSLYSGDGSQV